MRTGDGEVYRWDLRMNKPTVRHMNEAGSTSTSIAVSHNGQHYAVGYASEAGTRVVAS